MKFAQKGLKIFSYIEIALGVLYIALAVLTIAGTSVTSEIISSINIEGVDIKTVAIITFVLVALFSFLYAYLMQLACKNNKKTTLLLVLAALSTIGALKTVISTFSIINLISLVLNGLVLYFVIEIRKSAK